MLSDHYYYTCYVMQRQWLLAHMPFLQGGVAQLQGCICKQSFHCDPFAGKHCAYSYGGDYLTISNRKCNAIKLWPRFLLSCGRSTLRVWTARRGLTPVVFLQPAHSWPGVIVEAANYKGLIQTAWMHASRVWLYSVGTVCIFKRKKCLCFIDLGA